MATGCKWSTFGASKWREIPHVGIEAEYGRRLSDRLKWNVSGSYSNPRQKEMNENYWKQAAPKLQFTTGIRYESPTWEAGTSFSFVTNGCAIEMVA